ncbi:stage II sporulation protein D [Effusibacillus dendaii]|uniref:Stage II sporulation protein D n=1 Tax=Effusibacillus dendaii TaxID=2743772 RepID=A0A7I8DIS2_9BACL|nr:stage II sporulation protein D [Effusibacillus dendaii]BCJ87741.1 stage II sporulation protein D [Effusibacillus dendaii]
MNQAAMSKKPILLLFALTIVLMMVLPAGLIRLMSHGQPTKTVPSIHANEPSINVYLKETKQIVKMPLEEYVKGVVAAEMPVTFPLEALKAQAIAARTNAVKKIESHTLTPEGANVTDDYRQIQAYSTDEQLKQRWGMLSYEVNMSKIMQAVNETRGKILTYQQQPIEALFFSTSNGKTENAQDYFGRALPYLRTVDSPWDKQAKHATDTKTIPLKDMSKLLGINAVAASAGNGQWLQVLETSQTNRIKKIKVANQVMTGPDFREKLGLYSTDFSWKIDGDSIIFTTHGYGHGVGLSQYGAEGMAKEGKRAEDILAYYYQGTSIANYQSK